MTFGELKKTEEFENLKKYTIFLNGEIVEDPQDIGDKVDGVEVAVIKCNKENEWDIDLICVNWDKEFRLTDYYDNGNKIEVYFTTATDVFFEWLKKGYFLDADDMYSQYLLEEEIKDC